MAGEKNPLGGVLDSVVSAAKEKLGQKVHLERVLSEGNLKKKRNAFWSCLIAGALLAALALGAALYVNAVRVDTFETLLLEHVDIDGLGTDTLSVQSFARETIFFLSGAKERWEPQIVIQGFPASSFIPEAFRQHMDTVRSWFASAKAVLWAGLGIAALLLGRAVTNKRSGFSAAGYYLGAGAVLALVIGVGLAAYFRFDSLWMSLHKALIPDGIFAAAEPVMQLFPIQVFQGYLPPVGAAFGILAAIVLALPLALLAAIRLLARLPQKAASASGKARTAAKKKPSPKRTTAKKTASSAK